MTPVDTSSPPPAWLSQPLSDRVVAATLVAAVQEEARLRAMTLEFPPPPEPTACCGRGCNGCVWESYFAALAYWRERAAFTLYGVTAD